MKITFRMVAAIAVGTMILMSAAADAGTRPGISPNEAKRLRYQVQQYQQMKRYAGADGLIEGMRPGVMLKPEWFVRRVIWLIVHSTYRLRSVNMEHIPASGPSSSAWPRKPRITTPSLNRSMPI